jgi:hypothetical protein
MSFIRKRIVLASRSKCETLVSSLPEELEEAPVENRHISITLREKTVGFLDIVLNTIRKHDIGICIGKKMHQSSHSPETRTTGTNFYDNHHREILLKVFFGF